MRKMVRRREYSFLTNSVERNAGRSEFFRFIHSPSRAWYASNLISTARRISKNLIFFTLPTKGYFSIRKLNFRLQIRLSVDGTLLSRNLRYRELHLFLLRISTRSGKITSVNYVTRKNFQLRDSLMMFPATMCKYAWSWTMILILIKVIRL